MLNLTSFNTTSDSGDDDGSGGKMDTEGIVYITAEVVNAVVSIIGNSIVVASILRTQHLHTVTNVFIVSLALADIVVGFLVTPVAVSVYNSFDVDFYPCILLNTVILMFTNISILMLLAVAIERFIAISRPYSYVQLMTVRRAILLNVFVWLLGIILGLVPVYGWHKSKDGFTACEFTQVIGYHYMVYFQFFGLVLLPLFVMLVIYIYILRVVRYHTSRDNRHKALFQSQTTRKQRRDFKKDVQAAKYFALIILLFALFWLPVNIINTISLFWPEHFPPIEVLLAAIVLSHVNSSINPFLYAASNSRIKNAMMTTLHIPHHSLEDRDNSEHPHMDRPSSVGSVNVRDVIVRDVIASPNKPVSNNPGMGNLALSNPFLKTDLNSENSSKRSSEVDNNVQLARSAPEVVLCVSPLSDTIGNGRLEDGSPSPGQSDRLENSQTHNSPTKNGSPGDRYSPRISKNGYLKPNQIYPLYENQCVESADNSFNTQVKQNNGVDTKSNAEKYTIGSGYDNIAFTPDIDENNVNEDLEICDNTTSALINGDIPQTQQNNNTHSPHQPANNNNEFLNEERTEESCDMISEVSGTNDNHQNVSCHEEKSNDLQKEEPSITVDHPSHPPESPHDLSTSDHPSHPPESPHDLSSHHTGAVALEHVQDDFSPHLPSQGYEIPFVQFINQDHVSSTSECTKM